MAFLFPVRCFFNNKASRFLREALFFVLMKDYRIMDLSTSLYP